jgi:hypothetical protein
MSDKCDQSTPGSPGSALALRACEAAVAAEGYAFVRFEGGVLVFGIHDGKSVPLAASTVGGCYDESFARGTEQFFRYEATPDRIAAVDGHCLGPR